MSTADKNKIIFPHIPAKDNSGDYLKPSGKLIDLINIDGSFNSDYDDIYDFLHNDVSLQVLDLFDVYNKFSKNFNISEEAFEAGSVYDYKTNIKNLWGVINGFRSNLTKLVEFIDDQIDKRMLTDSKDTAKYVCFDFYEQLNSQNSCMWKGLFRSGPQALYNLKAEIEQIIKTNGIKLPPLIWSSELGHAAANYLTSIEGSRIIPGLMKDDQSSADFVDQFVSYKNHQRLTLLPWKFFWVSSLETVFDLILDDFDTLHPARNALLHGSFTHIGISCNCHPRLGQVCVFELAENPMIKLKPEYPWTLVDWPEPEVELEDCTEICLEGAPNTDKYNHCCQVVCNRPAHLGDIENCLMSNPFEDEVTMTTERRGLPTGSTKPTGPTPRPSSDQKVWLAGQLPLPIFKKPFDETCEDESAYWTYKTLEDGWMPSALRR